MRPNRLAGAATLFAALIAFACGDPDRFLLPVPAEPREGTIYDLFGTIVDRPSAFDLATGPFITRSDRTSGWDFVFAFLPDEPSAAACLQGHAPGTPVFLPRGCFEGLDPSSGIQRLDRAFEEVIEVSGSAADYTSDVAVVAEAGVTYAVRSRPDPALGAACRRYAKIEVLSFNPAAESMTIRYLWNPNCNLRRVAPSS